MGGMLGEGRQGGLGQEAVPAIHPGQACAGWLAVRIQSPGRDCTPLASADNPGMHDWQKPAPLAETGPGRRYDMSYSPMSSFQISG